MWEASAAEASSEVVWKPNSTILVLVVLLGIYQALLEKIYPRNLWIIQFTFLCLRFDLAQMF